ncbi:MAG: GNAT family N-acetyltransferase [Alphaproteobacteria bacterium]|nr:GNAT family N-acetyltransferase [Alphaproteobacteria bacterium]
MSPLTIPGFHTRPLVDGDVAAVEALFDEDPEYFEINGRRFPVEEMRTALPPGRSFDEKFTYVLERDGRAEGLIDIIRGFPEPHVWYLGFIFLSMRVRGGGTGRRCLHALYDWVRAQGGTVIRLGVVEPNAKARHLYATEGFEFEAMREIDPEAKRMRRTLVLRRAL